MPADRLRSPDSYGDDPVDLDRALATRAVIEDHDEVSIPIRNVDERTILPLAVDLSRLDVDTIRTVTQHPFDVIGDGQRPQEPGLGLTIGRGSDRLLGHDRPPS
jgi:hypothetical protein